MHCLESEDLVPLRKHLTEVDDGRSAVIEDEQSASSMSSLPEVWYLTTFKSEEGSQWGGGIPGCLHISATEPRKGGQVYLPLDVAGWDVGTFRPEKRRPRHFGTVPIPILVLSIVYAVVFPFCILRACVTDNFSLRSTTCSIRLIFSYSFTLLDFASNITPNSTNQQK